MENQRLLDKSKVPTEKIIASLLKQVYEIFTHISSYILSIEKTQVETKYFTKKYGWSRRFSKGVKTICYLFPEAEAFSILVVFGQKEVDLIESNKNNLSANIYNTIIRTEHFHDGRWVWLRIVDNSELTSLKMLIDIKTNKNNCG